MKLNELRDTSYEIAKSKGWHDPEFDTATFADRMALVISELAEALEEHRKGCPPSRIYFGTRDAAAIGSRENAFDLAADGKKPEGVIIELADVLIRIGDAAGRHDRDLEAAASESLLSVEQVVDLPLLPQAWAKCNSFGDWFCCVALEAAIASRMDPSSDNLFLVARATCCMVRFLGITGTEFVRAIEIKHAYNRTRPFRHGNKKL